MESRSLPPGRSVRPDDGTGQPAPLTRAFLRLGPVLVLALFAMTTAAVLASAGTTLGYDAAAYLQAGERLRAGQPLYDPAVDVAVGFGVFLYPPPFAFAAVPFTFVPAPLGLWAWLAAMVAAFLVGTAILPVRTGVRWSIVLLAALSFPFLYAVKLGQVGPLLYLAFAIGWRWIDHGAATGLAVAAGALAKLQPGLLFGWMVATRRWRALAVGAATVVVAVTVSAAVLGVATWSDYLGLLGRINKPVTTPQNLSVGAVAYAAGAGVDAASAIQWISVAATLAVTVFAWLRRDPVTGFLVGAVASQLLSPVLWSHYAMLLLLPVALLLERRRWWAAAIPLLAWVPAPVVYPLVFAAGLLGPIWGGRGLGSSPGLGRGGAGRGRAGAILASVTHATTPELDPPCSAAPAELIEPGARTPAPPHPAAGRLLRAVHRPFGAIAPATWEALAGSTPWATPFSRWGVQRAWWDAYGANAHDQTLLIVDDAAPDDAPPLAIVPLMHRHEVEPDDVILRTRMRGAGHAAPLTRVAPDRKAIFFGASYHADYATVLARPADLPAVARAVVDALAAAAIPGDPHPAPWDVIDLRRLRAGDPAADELAAAFEAHSSSQGWTVVREREEVCPVLDLQPGLDFDGYLGTLDGKQRHEVRRKIRRAEAAGEVRLEQSTDPARDLGRFIDLHQKRWGAAGLFPETVGGDQSRAFFRGLFDHCGPGGLIALHFLTVGGRRVAAGIWFDDGETLYFYNAGGDPEARELSPGVILVARSIEMALRAGRSRFDFLRGDEPYKYEWGAVDVPIQRLLVVRGGG